MSSIPENVVGPAADGRHSARAAAMLRVVVTAKPVCRSYAPAAWMGGDGERSVGGYGSEGVVWRLQGGVGREDGALKWRQCVLGLV